MRKSFFTRAACWALLLCLSLAGQAAEALRYSITGLDKGPQKNVKAWLGAGPGNALERSSLLVSARERFEHSLQALGYYQPVTDFTLQKRGGALAAEYPGRRPLPLSRLQRF